MRSDAEATREPAPDAGRPAAASTRAAEQAATTLDLDELIALRPRRARGSRPPGARGPSGERPGRGRSRSLNFDGLSPYAHGDDVRFIDWVATARSGETQVRRFAAERSRARFVVVDLSPDMYFGLAGRLMAKTAALAAARLLWEAATLHEPAALLAPGRLEAGPGRGRRAHLARLEALARAYADGRAAAEVADAADGEAPQRTDAADAAGPATLAAAVAAAGARAGPLDEIHVLSAFDPPDPALAAAARRAGGRDRTLVAWVVEDARLDRPAPPGRYPARRPDGARLAGAVGRRGGADAPAAAEAARAARRARLRAEGWEVEAAARLAPATDA